jgi:hypothetical protein
MATGTSNAHVGARQRKRGLAVIEGRGLPRGRCMTGCARRRNTGPQVWRIVGVVEILRVATVAIRRRSLIFPSNVTRNAIEGGMRPGERVARKFQVIELRSKPAIKQMARLAGRRKIESRVAWIRSFLEISHMAGQTVG